MISALESADRIPATASADHRSPSGSQTLETTEE